MQEAQASGVVNFDDKKKDKEEDGSSELYTHIQNSPERLRERSIQN